MSAAIRSPHYLLFSEARKKALGTPQAQGQWRFVLESVEGSDKLEALDDELEAGGDRLELLAVVRGLEALDQPSRVTLITPSRYVSRGLRFGIDEWRRQNWKWESYGQYRPVSNGDLWQRVDQAMKYHQVECRTWRFDGPHVAESHAEKDVEASHEASGSPSARRRRRVPLGRWRSSARKLISRFTRLLHRPSP